MIINNDINSLVQELQTKVILIIDALKYINCPIQIFECRRSPERQAELFKSGYSKTLNSKHLTGSAVDMVVKKNDVWTWDIKNPRILASYKVYATISEWYGCEAGFFWKSFQDCPHIQLKV